MTPAVYKLREIKQDSKQEIIKDWLPAKNRDENDQAREANSDLHFYNHGNELDPG